MTYNSLIFVVIAFALMGGGMAFLVNENTKLKVENAELREGNRE